MMRGVTGGIGSTIARRSLGPANLTQFREKWSPLRNRIAPRSSRGGPAVVPRWSRERPGNVA